MNEQLQLEESGETGKSWPHGERERRPITPNRPPLSPAMRALLEQHHDETYERGRQAGRLESISEFRAVRTLLIGALTGSVFTLLVLRVIA